MRIAVSFVALATFVGCSKKSGDDSKTRIEAEKKALAPIVEKHRATAGARFTALQNIDREAIAAPEIATAEPIATKLVASKSMPDQSDLEDDGILIASPGWLAGPGGPPSKFPLWPSRVPGPDLRLLFAEGYWDTSGYANPEAVEGALGMLDKVGHIIYVRTRSYTEPTVDDSTKTFTPPDASGDVLVYSVPEGKRVATFPFQHALARDTIETKLQGVEAVKLTFKTELLRKIIDEVVEAKPSN